MKITEAKTAALCHRCQTPTFSLHLDAPLCACCQLGPSQVQSLAEPLEIMEPQSPIQQRTTAAQYAELIPLWLELRQTMNGDEAAKLLGTSAHHLMGAMKRANLPLPPMTPKAQRRISREMVLRWIERREAVGNQRAGIEVGAADYSLVEAAKHYGFPVPILPSTIKRASA